MGLQVVSKEGFGAAYAIEDWLLIGQWNLNGV